MRWLNQQLSVALAVIASPAVLVATVSMVACGGSSSPAPTATSYFGTQSPGDAWSWTITRDASGSGTFSATNETSGATYSGNVATLSSRFLKLTITATTDGTVTVGTITYAVEFPNTALIVKPAGANDAPVIAAAQGTCPSPASYNWIKMPTSSWAEGSDPAYGTAVTSGTADSPSFSVVPHRLDGTALGAVAYTGSCSNGIITTTTSGTKFGATPSGVLIGDQGTNGGVFGMLQPASSIGTSAVVQQGREFRGFVYMVHPPTGQDGTVPIWSRTKGDGVITAGGYTDFASGTEDVCPSGQSCATLSLSAESPPGAFTGSLADTHPGSPVPVVLAVNQINGKYVVFGFSMEQAGGGANRYPYLILAMEQ